MLTLDPASATAPYQPLDYAKNHKRFKTDVSLKAFQKHTKWAPHFINSALLTNFTAQLHQK